MTDSKMEDSKETVKDARDAVDKGVAMMVDTEEEKEESTHPMDAQDENKELPHSKGTEVENEEPPHRDGTKARSTHSKDDPNPVDNVPSNPEDISRPDVKGLKLTKEGHLLEEQGLVETSVVVDAETAANVGTDTNELHGISEKTDDTKIMDHPVQTDSAALSERSLETKAEEDMREESKDVVTEMELPMDNETNEEEILNNGVTATELPVDTEIMEEESNNVVTGMELTPYNGTKEELTNAVKEELVVVRAVDVKSSNNSFLLAPNAVGDESGTEEEQAAFMKELETFHKERCLEFKPPRFYGEPLNCLKLWRAVIRLGGYEQVTSCKLWRQVGESFKPPKTCTTVSWTFRCFYEKALLEYEKHKMRSGDLPFNDVSFTEPTSAGNQVGHNQASGSGRARRDAAARAMQGWHSQRLLGNGEVGDPIIKDKNSTSTPKREKQLKSIGLLKRKKSSPVERAVKVARLKASKPQLDTMVVDIGPPADWVKINVQKTKDCFEVYALVPGLLREEVRVQSDPAGRLVISGQPEQLDNPWGVTPFKKVVSLPSRIDPHQTSAVVTLHGQLFVRVPFEQSDL